MRIPKQIIWVLFFLILFFIPPLTASAQSRDSEGVFFDQTGHWVRGEFLKYYLSTPNSLLTFGYPITDEMVDPINQQNVQYFQKVRLDLVNDNQRMYVVPAPLGTLLYNESGEKRPDLSVSKCRMYKETGKSICLSFLDFYDLYSGEKYFGLPISDLEIQDGLLVQYFENVRMEWHPDMPTGQKVVLSDLGKIYFDNRIGDPTLLEPAFLNAYKVSASMNVRSFVSKSLVGPKDSEILYVVVQDQYFNPIQKANIQVSLSIDGKYLNSFKLQATNSDGISQLEIPLENIPAKSVVTIDVKAWRENMDARSSTWFRTW